MKSKGFSLLEALIATFISLIVLLAIGELFSTGRLSGRRIDYQQRAQEYAAGILTTISKDLRTAERIVTTVLPSTNQPLFPIPAAYGNSQSGIAFSPEASPKGDIFIYRYDAATRAIVLEHRDWTNAIISTNNKFVSDNALRIDSFDCWYNANNVAIRITITDPSDANHPRITDETFIAIRYYN